MWKFQDSNLTNCLMAGNGINQSSKQNETFSFLCNIFLFSQCTKLISFPSNEIIFIYVILYHLAISIPSTVHSWSRNLLLRIKFKIKFISVYIYWITIVTTSHETCIYVTFRKVGNLSLMHLLLVNQISC